MLRPFEPCTVYHTTPNQWGNICTVYGGIAFSARKLFAKTNRIYTKIRKKMYGSLIVRWNVRIPRIEWSKAEWERNASSTCISQADFMFNFTYSLVLLLLSFDTRVLYGAYEYTPTVSFVKIVSYVFNTFTESITCCHHHQDQDNENGC